MRKGFETAFSAAAIYGKTDKKPPVCTAMEDVTFHKPVDIGDIGEHSDNFPVDFDFDAHALALGDLSDALQI